MTIAERKVMEKIYACINRMSGMQPTNPAYTEIAVKCNDKQCRAAREILMTLSHMNYGELDEAHERVGEAMKILGLENP